ncbi:hypothetical protein ABT154_31180 [Streptomyces sp. NPDC001728]|uniref:hypothetical protein n=1 Tax=Streptomyces sp. NPDC001728 TaxID=3154396 RepID=UPI003329A9A4
MYRPRRFSSLEVLGSGTLAGDAENDRVAPHIHVSGGVKADSAGGRTSHLLDAPVQFVTELGIEEWTSPTVTRPRNPDLYDVPCSPSGRRADPARLASR